MLGVNQGQIYFETGGIEPKEKELPFELDSITFPGK